MGGTYTGDNVSLSGLFTPEGVEIGWNVIIYSFTNANNCEARKQDSIFIDDCLNFNNNIEPKNNSVSIYPNPFNSILNIDTQIDNLEIKLLNLEGRIVLDTRITKSSKSINLSFLPSRVYIIYIGDEHSKYFQKILKR